MRALLAFLVVPLIFPFQMDPPTMAAIPCRSLEAPALNRFQIRYHWRQNNKRWFDNRLPDLNLDHIRYANLGDFLATVTCSGDPELSFDTRVQFSDLLIRQLLLHEMTHVATMDCVHGPKFQAEIQRLARAGAFDDLL